MQGTWGSTDYTCAQDAPFTFSGNYTSLEGTSALQVCKHYCAAYLTADCHMCMPYTLGGETWALSVATTDSCTPTAAADCGAAGCTTVYTQPGDEDAINKLLPYLVYAAVVCSVFGFIGAYAQYAAGEGLTYRLRSLFFKHFLTQSVGWHDSHSTSELTDSLAVDAAAARSLHIDFYPPVIGATIGLLLSLVLGLFYCWEWALVTLTAAPLVVMMLSLEVAVILGKEKKNSGTLNALQREKQHGVLMIQNQKVITSMGRSQEYVDMYVERVGASMRSLRTQLGKSALQSFWSMFFINGLFTSFAFWWAFELQIEGTCSSEDFYKSFIPFWFGIVLAPMMLTYAS